MCAARFGFCAGCCRRSAGSRAMGSGAQQVPLAVHATLMPPLHSTFGFRRLRDAKPVEQ